MATFFTTECAVAPKNPREGFDFFNQVKGAVSEWAEDRREDPSRNFHDRSTALKFKFARRNLRTDPSPHNAGGKWGKINDYSLLSGGVLLVQDNSLFSSVDVTVLPLTDDDAT